MIAEQENDGRAEILFGFYRRSNIGDHIDRCTNIASTGRSFDYAIVENGKVVDGGTISFTNNLSYLNACEYTAKRIAGLIKEYGIPKYSLRNGRCLRNPKKGRNADIMHTKRLPEEFYKLLTDILSEEAEGLVRDRESLDHIVSTAGILGLVHKASSSDSTVTHF